MKTVINFIQELNKNNNREWFAENKDFYNKAKEEFELIIDILISKIREFDPKIDVVSAKECTFRIYRDVRFSKDKRPYKDHFGAYIAAGGRKSKYTGYYLHVQEDNSFVGGGLYAPAPDILKKVRTDIFKNSAPYKEIINDKNFKKYFTDFYGEKLKTAPRGFPKDFKDIELLRLKHHAVAHKVSFEQVLSPNFIQLASNIFKSMKNFNAYFNYIIDKK